MFQVCLKVFFLEKVIFEAPLFHCYMYLSLEKGVINKSFIGTNMNSPYTTFDVLCQILMNSNNFKSNNVITNNALKVLLCDKI